MDKISGIVPSKRVTDRYYVTFESGDKCTVNLSLIARYSLFTGRILDDAELEAFHRDAVRTEAKARALRIIGTRNMSCRELERRLIEKGETTETARETVEWMEQIGAVNDREYAGMIVRHYSTKGYGLGRIRNELYRRGIDRELWDEALAEMPEGHDAIDRFIELRLKGRAPEDKELKRVTDALVRRGFAWEDIRVALARYNSAIEESDE